MACGTTGVIVERVWADDLAIFKLPSGYEGKVLMVVEDPFDVSVRVVTEEEYRQHVERLLR